MNLQFQVYVVFQKILIWKVKKEYQGLINSLKVFAKIYILHSNVKIKYILHGLFGSTSTLGVCNFQR